MNVELTNEEINFICHSIEETLKVMKSEGTDGNQLWGKLGELQTKLDKYLGEPIIG
jgi:hypothetical protein